MQKNKMFLVFSIVLYLIGVFAFYIMTVDTELPFLIYKLMTTVFFLMIMAYMVKIKLNNS